MECPAGFEPATLDLEGRCSIPMSYGHKSMVGNVVFPTALAFVIAGALASTPKPSRRRFYGFFVSVTLFCSADRSESFKKPVHLLFPNGCRLCRFRCIFFGLPALLAPVRAVLRPGVARVEHLSAFDTSIGFHLTPRAQQRTDINFCLCVHAPIILVYESK